MTDDMKKIWVLEFADGTAEVCHETQSAPAWPYVCAFDAKREIEALQERIDALESLSKVAREVAVSALPSFSGGRPTVDNDAIVALRHAFADMEGKSS